MFFPGSVGRGRGFESVDGLLNGRPTSGLASAVPIFERPQRKPVMPPLQIRRAGSRRTADPGHSSLPFTAGFDMNILAVETSGMDASVSPL